MSKYSLSAELCQKNSKKRPKYDVLSDTGELLRAIIISNNYNKRLAGAHYAVRDELKPRIKRQIFNSCFCRTRLHVDEARRINVEYSCQAMWCMPCGNALSFKKLLRFFPYIQKVFLLSQMQKLAPNWWFLTLTVPTCEAQDLETRLTMLQKAWRYIQQKAKKHDINHWDGIRKLEVNHSLKKELRGVCKGENKADFMYHAHFHFLILSRETGRLIKEWWSAWWAKQGIKCSQKAQKLIQVGDSKKQAYDGKNKPVKALMELLKYVSKPVAPIDQNKIGEFRAALHIYNCLSGRRKVEAFGQMRRMAANQGQIEAWVKSLSDDELEVLNLLFLRKKYAERDGLAESTGEALDTGETGRYIVEGEDHLIGKTFNYDAKRLRYICRGSGESLTSLSDFDETNKRHISQNIVRQARRYKLFEDRIDIVMVLSHLAKTAIHSLNGNNIYLLECLKTVYAQPKLYNELIKARLTKKIKVTRTIADGPIKIERDAQGNDLFMRVILRGDRDKFDELLPCADFHIGNKRKQTCVHLAAQQDDTYYIEQIIGRGWGKIAFKDIFLMMPSSYVADLDIKLKVQNYEKREKQSKKIGIKYGKRSKNYLKILRGTIFKKILTIPSQQAQRVNNVVRIEASKLIADEDVSTVVPVVADLTQHNIGARLKKSDIDCLKAIIDSPRGQAIRYDHVTDRVYIPHINKWLDFYKKIKNE